jgi:hypothetical protein
MDPRVSATAFGLLRPRMTNAWVVPAHLEPSSLVQATANFAILRRSRSEANCADLRIHAVTLAKSAAVQT